jgi:hypothetical protein
LSCSPRYERGFVRVRVLISESQKANGKPAATNP